MFNNKMIYRQLIQFPAQLIKANFARLSDQG